MLAAATMTGLTTGALALELSARTQRAAWLALPLLVLAGGVGWIGLVWVLANGPRG
jgi:hypothetical protein